MITLRILVSGAQGKVGRCIVQAVENADDMVLAGQVDRHDNLSKAIQANRPDAVVDFTTPEAAYKNALTIVEEGVHPVIGTTGFTGEQIADLTTRCEREKLGGLIAPNFSISAVLMMRFAQSAATYFDDVEIIEMHHSAKKDAPSGTSIKTAEMIALARQSVETSVPDAHPARGMNRFGVPIHAVRLPGLIAHQAVMFSGAGETLTIRQDTMSRESFAPGVLLACRKIKSLSGLVYGLDSLLD